MFGVREIFEENRSDRAWLGAIPIEVECLLEMTLTDLFNMIIKTRSFLFQKTFYRKIQYDLFQKTRPLKMEFISLSKRILKEIQNFLKESIFFFNLSKYEKGMMAFLNTFLMKVPLKTVYINH